MREFLNIEQAARRSGFDRRTVRKWLHEKKVPYMQYGKSFKIPRDKFDEFISTLWVKSEES